MIFTLDELRSYTNTQLHVLASYLGLEVEGDEKEELIKKIYDKVNSVYSIYELWEENPCSVQIQRIRDSQKESV